jgi:hypothetical protein
MNYEQQTRNFADSSGNLPAGMYMDVLDDHRLDPVQYLQATPVGLISNVEHLLAYVAKKISVMGY